MFDLEATEKAIFALYALIYALRDSAENLNQETIGRYREIVINFETIFEEKLLIIQENISKVNDESKS